METETVTSHWYSKDFSQYISIWSVKAYDTKDHGLVVTLEDNKVIVITDVEDAASFIVKHTECRERVRNI